MATREENLNKINTELEKLDDEQLEQVAGGTFNKNNYDERIYNQAGIKTDYHFFKKDEFWLQRKNGEQVAITYDQANEAVALWQKVGESVPLTYESYIDLKKQHM